MWSLHERQRMIDVVIRHAHEYQKRRAKDDATQPPFVLLLALALASARNCHANDVNGVSVIFSQPQITFVPLNPKIERRSIATSNATQNATQNAIHIRSTSYFCVHSSRSFRYEIDIVQTLCDMIDGSSGPVERFFSLLVALLVFHSSSCNQRQ